MVYLVILVLVAVAALVRLWLQQHREQTQMDTIEGFSSALEAMAPPSRPARRERSRDGRSRFRVPKAARLSLLGWFVADRSGTRARSSARRKVEARETRRRHQARRRHEARRRYEARRREETRAAARRKVGGRRRGVRNGEISLPDARPAARGADKSGPRRVPVGAGSASGNSRYERYAG